MMKVNGKLRKKIDQYYEKVVLAGNKKSSSSYSSSSSSSTSYDPSSNSAWMNMHSFDTCNYCSMIVSWLEFYIGQDASSEEVAYILENYICNISENLDQVCSVLLNSVDSILDFVSVRGSSSENVCLKLNLCEEDSHLLNTMIHSISRAKIALKN